MENIIEIKNLGKKYDDKFKLGKIDCGEIKIFGKDYKAEDQDIFSV